MSPMIEKSKVLIVDDKEENLVALKTVFEDVDVEVITAIGGNEALKSVLHHEFATT